VDRLQSFVARHDQIADLQRRDIAARHRGGD
jgi:hypothetical protein